MDGGRESTIVIDQEKEKEKDKEKGGRGNKRTEYVR